MSEIRDRHVLITGGASGIGRLLARELTGLGGRVTVWDVNAASLEGALAELREMRGGAPQGFRCDVSNRAEVYQVAKDSTATAGPVDILINNAGIVSGRTLLEIPDEKIERTFAINTLSLFWVTKAFLPAMVERNRGHIVNIASASALIGVARLTDYAASKWAAMGFDESLRAELRQIAPAVVTTVVCPFYIDTGMFRGVKTRFPALLPILQPDAVTARIVDAIRRDRRRLVMPPLVATVPLMRALPVRAFDWVATFLGVNASMDEFEGR